MKEKLKTDLRRVTLRQLRIFAAAAEAGTVSGAAQTLNVTPPAVSLQLRQLEDSAGLPLLERSETGLQPTDGGREILDSARRIEAALAECQEALEALSGVEGGRVSVGVISTAKYFAPRALAAFARIHPRVEIRLHVGNRRETIEALKGYNLDFAVMGRPPEAFQVEKAVIGEHPHIIIGPPGHPLSKRRQLSISDFAEETFLLREPGSGTRLLMQRLFSKARFAPRIGMEIGSNETIKQAVMAGLGIALLSAHTVSAELRDGRLIAFQVQGLPVLRKWFVVRLRSKRLLPAGRALWDFMASEGADFLPDLPAAKGGRRGTAKPATKRRKARSA